MKCLKGSRKVNDDPTSGRPSTLTDKGHIAWSNELVRSDRRLTIREMAEDCNNLFVSFQEIVRKNWKCVTFLQSLFPDSWRRHINSIGWCLWGYSWEGKHWKHIPSEHRNSWRNMVLRVWRRDESPIIPVVNQKFSETQESPYVVIKCHLLHGSCSPRIPSTRSDNSSFL